MPSLPRRVAMGMASHGEVRQAVRFAQQARACGAEAVWFHESYFERDAVTFASAVALEVPEIKIGIGAINPSTRHPVLSAMTFSALDDLAPGRMMLALGSALPLRLGQMGIPYEPNQAIADIEQEISVLRDLWRGERLPSGTPGLPQVEPMFPPLHHLPIWVAGYRRAFHELAARSADGYLARPAEPLPAVALAKQRIEAGLQSAGRPPGSVDIGGYLLCLADTSRRAALDRAKREPFVIYMLSVQSDATMRRAGLDPQLRVQVAEAWRREDYHGAAQLIPDELVDAFVLCGAPADIAGRAEEYHAAGMALPIMQPILQEEAQVEAVLNAAVIYGSAGAMSPTWGRRQAPSGNEDRGIPILRRARGWLEVTRPFSLTASVIPVLVAGALVAASRQLNWALLVMTLVAGAMLQVGTNVVNEIYDVRKGVDAITSPRASQALLTGRVPERQAFILAGTAFLVTAALGIYFITVRGWPLLALGAAGLLGGWGYTAPPLQYKYRAVGLPLVFLLMGPLMVLGAFYNISGHWSLAAGVASIPIGLLVAAILHGNEWRDIGEDGRAGISTVSILLGRRFAHLVYVFLLLGAYVALSLAVAFGALPRLSLLAILSLPLLVRALGNSELGAAGQQRAIAMIDLETAQLHAAFGSLLVLGFAIGVFWHPGV